MLCTHGGRRAAICALTAVLAADPAPDVTRAAPPPISIAPPRAPPPPSFAEAPPPLPEVPAGRRQILVPGGNPIEVYPPRAALPVAPLTVMVHGLCAGPVDVCDFWSDQGREGSWLACPAGNVRCGNAFDWGGPTADRTDALAAQLAAVDRAFGPLVDHTRGDVVIGFSRGAFTARDLLYARPRHFRGAVFLGAKVEPDPARLRAAGIERVVLGAGEYDVARPSMKRSAAVLAAGGVEARFVTLGRIGHWLPADVGGVLRDAIAWIREDRSFSRGAVSHRRPSNDTGDR